MAPFLPGEETPAAAPANSPLNEAEVLKPRSLKPLSPDYPKELLEAGIEGRVVLQFRVNVQGRAEDIQVTKHSCFEFEEAAIAAVNQARFEPGTVGGVATAMQASRSFEFQTEAGKLGNTKDEQRTFGVRTLKPLRPPYPKALLKKEIEGKVTLQYKVNLKGRAEQIQVLSSNAPEFSKEAVTCVQNAHFVPAMDKGIPHETMVQQSFVFRMD